MAGWQALFFNNKLVSQKPACANPNGLFSTAWYFTLLICFIGVIWFFAGMGDDVLGLPLKILQS
jgi:hypothetical protein